MSRFISQACAAMTFYTRVCVVQSLYSSGPSVISYKSLVQNGLKLILDNPCLHYLPVVIRYMYIQMTTTSTCTCTCTCREDRAN